MGSTRLTLLLILVKARSEELLVKRADDTSFECMNPLFRGQWYTGELDIAQLEARPRIHQLLGCKLWSGNSSCCNSNLEALQRRAFLGYKEHFDSQIHVLAEYSTALMDLKDSDVFEMAETLEQKLLQRAMHSIQSAVKLAESCIIRLMAFVAGMICFACQPDWSAFVWRSGLGEVVGVNIDPEACVYVDWGCGMFGRAVQKAYSHVMESTLAKRLHTSLPDFSMMYSRLELCRWLRSVLAMQPMSHRAHRAARRLEPSPVTVDPSALSAWPKAIEGATALPTEWPTPQAPPDATSPALALDPAKDGLATDFGVSLIPS
ncbi:Hypothetical protein (Fragment) [Durusdinium trenchii]|uniref:Uncharacterized protein n=1 Tax=Durusdinium trenchii TaxID=1381693 RepID=A0ABP0QG11_9DINO